MASKLQYIMIFKNQIKVRNLKIQFPHIYKGNIKLFGSSYIMMLLVHQSVEFTFNQVTKN